MTDLIDSLLTSIETSKEELAENLTEMGVESSANSSLNTLVNNVLQITTGAPSNYTIIPTNIEINSDGVEIDFEYADILSDVKAILSGTAEKITNYGLIYKNKIYNLCTLLPWGRLIFSNNDYEDIVIDMGYNDSKAKASFCINQSLQILIEQSLDKNEVDALAYKPFNSLDNFINELNLRQDEYADISVAKRDSTDTYYFDTVLHAITAINGNSVGAVGADGQSTSEQPGVECRVFICGTIEDRFYILQLLKDVSPTGQISVSENMIFDLNGYRLSLSNIPKNTPFRINNNTITHPITFVIYGMKSRNQNNEIIQSEIISNANAQLIFVSNTTYRQHILIIGGKYELSNPSATNYGIQIALKTPDSKVEILHSSWNIGVGVSQKTYAMDIRSNYSDFSLINDACVIDDCHISTHSTHTNECVGIMITCPQLSENYKENAQKIIIRNCTVDSGGIALQTASSVANTDNRFYLTCCCVNSDFNGRLCTQGSIYINNCNITREWIMLDAVYDSYIHTMKHSIVHGLRHYVNQANEDINVNCNIVCSTIDLTSDNSVLSTSVNIYMDRCNVLGSPLTINNSARLYVSNTNFINNSVKANANKSVYLGRNNLNLENIGSSIEPFEITDEIYSNDYNETLNNIDKFKQLLSDIFKQKTYREYQESITPYFPTLPTANDNYTLNVNNGVYSWGQAPTAPSHYFIRTFNGSLNQPAVIDPWISTFENLKSLVLNGQVYIQYNNTIFQFTTISEATNSVSIGATGQYIDASQGNVLKWKYIYVRVTGRDANDNITQMFVQDMGTPIIQ